MKITDSNVPGLSSAWIDAAYFLDHLYDKEEKGWRTTTQLVKPLRHILLMERHDHEITEDITDRVNTLVGSAGHELLARAAMTKAGLIVEQRFTIPCLGKEIGIKADRVDIIPNTNPLEYKEIDFKFASVWAVILSDKIEWINQGIINSYALRSIGINVTQAQNEVKMTDWAYREAVKNHDYPQYPLAVIPVELKPDKDAQAYLESRVQLFIDHENTSDSNLPECTHQERWAKNNTYAIIKKEKTRATRVLPSEQEAKDYMTSHGHSVKEYDIKFRPGESTRCLRFCPARNFCNQYNATESN